eukprot:COSAG01_NODE_2658_length_7302_cov_4.298626_6_plen_134_part_00
MARRNAEVTSAMVAFAAAVRLVAPPPRIVRHPAATTVVQRAQRAELSVLATVGGAGAADGDTPPAAADRGAPPKLSYTWIRADDGAVVQAESANAWCAGRCHLVRGPFWLRFTYATPCPDHENEDGNAWTVSS